MSANIINGEMQITRCNRNKIHIEVQCSDSLAHFLAIELTPDQFAMLVTGCHQSNIKMEVRGLDKVGKLRVRETRQVLCPLTTWDREKLSEWLEEHCQEEGYVLNSPLGSQTSTKSVDGGTLLNYSICKWVDKE